MLLILFVIQNQCTDMFARLFCNTSTSTFFTTFFYYMLFMSACQRKIGGWWGIDCTSCVVNGAGKCDPDGCPNKTAISYYEYDKQCVGRVIKYLLMPEL